MRTIAGPRQFPWRPYKDQQDEADPRSAAVRSASSTFPNQRAPSERTPGPALRVHSTHATIQPPVRALLVLAFASFAALGQGGPPLMTDDPGTPGPRRWEINVAWTLDESSRSKNMGTPLIDANYGWGERIQLKIEIPWVVLSQEGVPTQNGVGNPNLGVKWRFLDEDSAGIAVSTYPQLEVNLSSTSAEKGLVEHRPQFLLPVSAKKVLGPVEVNGEIGGLFQGGEVPQWVWGLAFGHGFAARFEALAELFGETGSNPVDRQTLLDLGFRWRVLRRTTILFSAGRSLWNGGEEGPLNRIYAGIQLTLGPLVELAPRDSGLETEDP